MTRSKHLALADVPIGRHARIHNLRSTPDVCKRLREMGFCENALVRCVTKGDNIICEVCNSRIGLNKEIAGSILVSTIE